MHALLKSQIFCGSESYLWSDQSFHHRVVGKVEIHDYMVGYAAFLKGPAEKFRYVVFYTHCRKDNGEVFITVPSQRSLLYDLGRQLVMGKAVAGENRQLLSADQSSQSIDGRNTGLDKVSGVFSGHRIQRQAVNIQTGLGGYWSQAVYGPSDAIKGAAQDFRRVLKSNDITEIAEADVRFHDVICIATENQKLVQLLNNLREQMYRYRIEYLKKKECYPQLLSEHKAIIEAIENHDKEKATAITGQHINNQVDTVVGTLRHKE